MYTVGPTLSVRGALSIFSLEVGATPPTRAGRRRVVGCDPCGAPNKCRRARRPDLRNPMPTILVIDDNPSVATALDVLFSLQDIDPLRAESPREGPAQLQRHAVDLVIPDLNVTADTPSGEENTKNPPERK